MKKNLLFSAMALLLTCFGLGGVSMANYTSGSVDCWKSKDSTACTGSDYGTYDVNINESGDTITFSNLKLQYPNDDIIRPLTGGWVGVKFIATGENLHFNGASFDGIENDSGYTDDGSGFIYEWFGFTATGAKDKLGKGTDKITWIFKITGDNNSLEMTFNVVIDLNNVTLYSGSIDDNHIDFQSKDGKVVKYEGKSTAWEIDCWRKDGVGECTSDVGTYSGKISDDKQTITFSNIKLNYPKNKDGNNDRPHSGYAGFFGAKIIASPLVTDSNSGSAYMKIGDNKYGVTGSTERTGGRIVLNWWPNLTTGDIVELLKQGKTEETFVRTVSWSGNTNMEETLKVIVDLKNIAYYSGDTNTTINEDNIDFKVENGKITILNGKQVFYVNFNSNGGSTVDKKQVTSGETVDKPTTTQNCNSFNGWYLGSEKFDFSTPITGDITLTAKWTYTCSRSSGGGGSSSKATTTKTDTNTTPTEDTKKAEDNVKNTDSDTDIGGDTTTNGSTNNPQTVLENGYTQEMNDAYTFAKKNGITTMDSIEEANMNGSLTRIAMAKMLSQYAINVLGKTPDATKVVPEFSDVDEQLNTDYNNGVTLAYQLGIMGIGIKDFRPNDLVTRAEFGTALSRMLYGIADGEGAYYETHLKKLLDEKIITVDTPDLQEVRGYVMIMLMRSAN